MMKITFLLVSVLKRVNNTNKLRNHFLGNDINHD